MGESANSFTSPFESGDWGRWTNLERFSWLRSFHRGMRPRRRLFRWRFRLGEIRIPTPRYYLAFSFVLKA